MSSGFEVEIPFVEHLGFKLVVFDAGVSEIHYEPLAEHTNSFAMAHGGALMTLMDATMAMAARSTQKEWGALTIEMKSSFMQAARGKLIGKGRLIHQTKSMAFTEATVLDGAGRICAHATGSFKLVKPQLKPIATN